MGIERKTFSRLTLLHFNSIWCDQRRSEAERDNGGKGHTSCEHLTTLEDRLSFEKRPGLTDSSHADLEVVDSLSSFEAHITLTPFGLKVSKLVFVASLFTSRWSVHRCACESSEWSMSTHWICFVSDDDSSKRRSERSIDHVFPVDKTLILRAPGPVSNGYVSP